MERRIRNFPMTFEITKPTRFDPGGVKMYYAHEWEAHLKESQSAQSTDDPAQANEAQTQPTAAHAEAPPEMVDAAAASPSESSASSISSTSFASSTSSTSSASLPPDFSRHSRRCAVCCHPDRDAIEGDFIRWRSPRIIAGEYHLPDHNSIYRHAHATGLFRRRRSEFARVLENLLECVDHCSLEKAGIIVSASRVYARLDDEGRWFEPSRTHIILTGQAYPPRPQSDQREPRDTAACDASTPEITCEAKESLIAIPDPTRIAIPPALSLPNGSDQREPRGTAANGARTPEIACEAKESLIATPPDSENGPTS